MFKKLSLAAAVAAFALNVHAGGVAVDVGTMGVGLDYLQPVTDWVSVRVGANYLKYNYDKTHDGIDYSGDLKFSTQHLAIDIYPFTSSNFRLTVAAYHNGNEIDLSGTSNTGGTVTFNGVDYTLNSNSSIKATGKFDSSDVSPYLGFGWSSRSSRSEGFHFKGDIGVLFQNPEVKLKVSGVNDPNGTLSADVKAEQKKLQDDADKLKLYPVVQLGFSYDF